ncbi:hypothetical protein [Campylobacter devanensis]|uniref:hypothetical protein n=1 Tax=Campylobacter devanensis TaxID=3161138 RepID=UPI000A359392|nr:hypothetical protein [Campylobacter sp. P0087]
MKDKVANLIFEALSSLNEELENSNLNNPTLDTKIYGVDGNLDSLALVSFIADLEELLSSELNLDIILADEKAMSRRNSPFKDVQTLVNYIMSKVG